MPKVSVIINCLNGENYVREAIQSVYDQTYPDWEIIFWDNASNDRTAEIAKSFDDGRLHYFCSQETVPLGQARQWAMAKASGEWLAILDHDDMFLPLRLERQLAELEKDDYVLSYAGYREIDEYGHLLRSVLPYHRSGRIFNDLLVDFEINIATVMMRRDALSQLKMETIASFLMAEDYYLYLGLAVRGVVCVVPEVLVTYRQVSASWTERALHRHAIEFHETLDQLENDMPGITARYRQGFIVARARAEYARAKYEMSNGEYTAARARLWNIHSIRRAYAILFLVSFWPSAWRMIHGRALKARLTNIFLGQGRRYRGS
jgi:glycosyltransferase involved in cell wall biosynthesis